MIGLIMDKSTNVNNSHEKFRKIEILKIRKTKPPNKATGIIVILYGIIVR